MTHLLAAVRQLLRQTFCPHASRKSRKLAVHRDGRPVFAWHCERCDGTGVEYGK